VKAPSKLDSRPTVFSVMSTPSSQAVAQRVGPLTPDELTVRPSWLMARVLISDADECRSMALNSYVWQCFSCVERVTGIEPALSAWEPT
jgi:hypothetical protein